jgi:predicted Zn-dependent protease
MSMSIVAALVAPAAAKPTLGKPSKAVTDEIVDVIAEEMNRSMTLMQIEGQPAPYHISYKITEVEVHDVVASGGEATTRRARHFVNLEARVRVGIRGPAVKLPGGGMQPGPILVDNGNFIVPGAEHLDGVQGGSLPLEPTPRIARRVAWSITDAAYKEALVQLKFKLDKQRGSGAPASGVPPWTTEKNGVQEEPVLVPELEPLAAIEDRARTLSATFRDQPHIRDSRVAITSYLERRWYLNSDGTSITDTRRVSGIAIVAAAQADDGQDLAQYYLRYGHTAKDLPNDAELAAEAKKLSTTLAALQKAPVIDRYSGPVLFEGEGAVGLIRFALAPHLGGTPLPENLPPSQAKLFGGELTDKIGYRVTSPSISIVDDPTASVSNGKAMIGDYKIDDEGVPAARVDVVKDGVLKSLLTSRTPSRAGVTSNGHARRTTQGGVFHGSATNLIVTGRGGLARKQLVAKLLATARAEGVPHALIIRQIDDKAITAAPELTRRELYQMVTAAHTDFPPPTTLAYRVLPNGKEELVRGVQLKEIPIKVWKDIIAVGKTPTVFNFLASGDSYLKQIVDNGTEEGGVPTAGIESAIVTPDLLIKELDVVKDTGVHRTAAPVPAPK